MLLSCNAKFKKTTGWFLVLVMGWCLIGFNEAGVIKKRDTELRSTTKADLDDKLRVNLKEIQPTVLTAISNKSEVVTTKLQLVTGNSFVTESSKELTNNEILINEAKKLLEEEDKLIKSNKEMELKEERQERQEEEQEEQEEKKEEQEEKKEELKENDSIEQNNIKLNNLTKETKSEEEDNLQDIKQIILNLENKEQQLSDSSKSSTEFASNVIKEDKILMLGKNENKKELQQQEDISSLENNLKYNAEKPRPPSRILTELRTETEAPNKKPKQQETQLENSIESISPAKEKESSIEIISLENNTNKTDDTISIKKEEKVSEVLNTNNLENKHNEKEYLAMKPMDFEQKENNNNNNEKVNLNTTPLMQINENEKETSTSVNQVTEDKEVLEIITINPFNNLNNSKVEDQEISQDQSNSNKIQDGLDLEELFKSKQITTTESSLSELATTLQPESKEGDLQIFEGEKKEYARSMFKEDLTTLRSTDNNEILMPITTYRPIILSVKEENLTDHIIDNKSFNIKEKKPKFINDNSTNAQQLNLPNNAEVWSLASMKSLPKVNVSLETEQAHNQTIKKDFEENLVNNNNNNNDNNNNTMMKINSEKNLLDWSQIMRDKELSTTTRNEEEKVTEKLQEPEQKHEKTLENNAEFKEEEVTLNSLLDKENLNNIISTTTKATILSFSNNNNNNNNDNINNNETDKKFKENMNNHLEMITETLDVATTTTTATTTESTNMVNNPFNTTLNMKPNFNEINLTLKNTQAELNNHNEEEVHTTPTSTKAETETETAGKLNNDFEVKTKLTSTPTSLLMTTLTSTETTAVNDMTTVEQISSETTTVSTLETSKQNTTLNNIDPRQTEYETYNNVNFVKSNYSTEHYNNNNELEINTLEKVDIKLKNQYENNKEEEDLIKISTTTVLPITTFRPNILAITSTTSIPVKFEQEVSDQNGNNEFQTQQQQQSITETNLNVNNKNNTIKISETHLLEREFETTTVETTTTTAATATPAVELAETKTETENTLTTTTISTTTSSSKEEPITERILETKETTTTPTTPKFVKETTIGSADTINENIEKKLNETATATTENIITSTTTEITKTPVVFESFTSTPTTTTATTSSTTTASYTEQNIITTTTTKPTTEKETEHNKEENILNENNAKLDPATTSTTTMSTTIITTTTTAMPVTTIKDEETYISLLDDTTTTTTTTTTTQKLSPTISMTSTAPTPIPTSTTLTSTELSSSTSTMPSAITTKIEEIYNVIHSTTTEIIQTTTQQLITESVEDDSSTSSTPTTSSSSSSTSPLYTTLETETTTPFSNMIDTADIGKSLPTLTSIMGGNSGNMYPKNSEASGETDVNVIIAITVSVIGVIALILLVGFLYLMRKRQKQNSYPNRCRPVSMDEFTIDNASVGGSMRKSSALRSSKRTYGNLAFDDPSLRHNPMGVHELAKFVQEKLRIFEEFRDVPQITSRLDEVPPGCEDKNRYANVLPLPETRVILQRLNDDDKTEYINANYVTGPKDPPNYYIACQAPLESTVEDFWRMIWEQQSRVIIQATDLIENGVEKCAEYLPPSVTLDNHSSFGDFQITLQNREVKDKYAISTILLKNVNENASRELTHYWYKWPEVGVPSEEAPIIAMLLEARSSLISYAIEQANEDKEKSSLATLKAAEEGTAGTMNGGATSPTTNNSNGSSANGSSGEINGNISMVHIKKTARNQGPLTVHCSPGTGRTGTIIACDIAIRSLETPKRTVDIPQIVYYVRRGRASAVLTKEQYEFIYKVANMYAAKITNPTNYN